MTDRNSTFWQHFGQGEPLDQEHHTDAESVYRAWKEFRKGEVAHKLLLVPSGASQAETWRIPYLQTIIQRYDRQNGQLCLMFPSSELTVFIRGRGLQPLDELIDSRKVKSIHMFDEAVHQPIGNDVPVVTEIIIEQEREQGE